MIDINSIKKFNFKKEYIVPAVGVGIATFVFGMAIATSPSAEDIEMAIAQAEVIEAEAESAEIDNGNTSESNVHVRETEYRAMGYSSIMDYHNDLIAKQEEAWGIADAAIGMYYMSEEQQNLVRECEEGMTGAVSFKNYDKYAQKFDEIIAECDPIVIYSSGDSGSYGSSNGSSSGSYGSDPYNFKFLGILQDSNYLYSYYSSNVSRHYRTDEWNLGEDLIWRDSDGRVIVASDDYPQGTIVQSEIFGECIVADSGVGSSGKLDVYTGY